MSAYETTYNQARADAVKMLPGADQPGHPAHGAILALKTRIEKTNPAFFDNPEYPILLATMALANRPKKIRLRLFDGGSGRIFHFFGRSGKLYRFRLERRSSTHVLTFPLARWQANGFALSKDIFNRELFAPIVPEVA